MRLINADASTVDPYVHAKWIYDEKSGHLNCSNCHKTFITENSKHMKHLRFFPNCGAKMNLED